MENEKRLVFIKITKILIVTIIIAIVCFIGLKLLITHSNETKMTNYFKEQGYTEVDGIWIKENEETTNNVYTYTNYMYEPNVNTFSKETKTNSDIQEQYSFKYNGSDELEVNYSYKKYDCTLNQTATYNYKTHNFICNTDYRNGSCNFRCDAMKIESKNFADEVTDILKNADINTLFVTKNKD